MRKYKIVLITGMAAILLSFPLGQGQAVTSIGSSGKTSEETSQERVRIYKVVGFIKKIENNILYLENKQQYNLRSVKITRLSGKSSRISNQKWAAEMLFVNGVLKEVVIR